MTRSLSRDGLRLLGVLLLGSVLTVLAAAGIWQADRLRLKERQTLAADAVLRALNQEFTRTVEALRTAGLMMEANPQLTRSQFNGYVQKLVQDQLSINVVEWQPIVPARDLKAFEAEARASGLPDFSVVEPDSQGLSWRPVSGRDPYVVVRYAWPESYRTLGYDLSFSPERMASKLESQALGVPVASGVFDFMKEGKVRSGSAAIAISTAVFDAAHRPRGYVAAVVDLPTLFHSASELAQAGGLQLRVYAGQPPAAPPVFVAGLDAASALPGPEEDLRSTIAFARQTWLVVLRPGTVLFPAWLGSPSSWVLLGGLCMSLLMTRGVHLLQKSRRRIDQAERAAQRARDLVQRQADQLLEAQRVAHLGNWQIDIASGRATWSSEIYGMLGLPPGVPVPTLQALAPSFDPGSWQRLEAAMAQARQSGETFELELEVLRAGGNAWMLVRGAARRDASGALTELCGVAMDITDRKRAELEAKSLAFYDPLTALPNRRLLLDRLRHALAFCARQQRLGAVLFIDLDDFKTVNDTLGHPYGDLLLQQVAARLVGAVRAGDTVGRLGGDEFVVILEDLGSTPKEAAEHAEITCEKLLDVLRPAFQLGLDQQVRTVSIGVTLFGSQDKSADELLKRADVAMYGAKSSGRHTVRFFDESMQAVVVARARLESEMRRALRDGGFVLHYQAKVNAEGEVTGAEALIRMVSPDRGLVSPAEFIPLAEETGLILPLGQWVLQSACEQLRLWAAAAATSDLAVSVNVSSRQFQSPAFVPDLIALLDRTGVRAELLLLELTESVLLAEIEDAVDKMRALRARGVRFALDDFGTGFSSLAYLKRLPLDQLKIDKCFVDDLLENPEDAEIARMIIVLAESLGLSVIAEGVERAEQQAALMELGCREFQGYWFARPVPVSEFEAFIRQGLPAALRRA